LGLLFFPIEGGFRMEPQEEPKKRRFRIETLEERIAPAHVVVNLPERAFEAQNEHSGHLSFQKVSVGGKPGVIDT
jgi:hypothetical protein